MSEDHARGLLMIKELSVDAYWAVKSSYPPGSDESLCGGFMQRYVIALAQTAVALEVARPPVHISQW